MRLPIFLLAICCFSSETDEYLKLLSEHPALAARGEGRIELILDPEGIGRVEAAQTARWVRKGIPEEAARFYSRVGIVTEGPYWIWIRDAVHFPGGAEGTYERLLWKKGLDGTSGVAVLPLLPDGKIVLNLNFRHATRSWEWEFPRGGLLANETEEEAVRRELEEETGWRAGEIERLGEIAPDSGCFGYTVPVYACLLERKGEPSPEETEAIETTRAFTWEEIEEGLKRGGIDGIPLRDPVLTYGLFQYRNLHRGNAEREGPK